MGKSTTYSGGGRLYFRKLKADGTFEPPMYFGKTDGITLDTSVDFKEHFDTEGCDQVLDARLAQKKTANVKFESAEITLEMLNRAFSGDIVETSQAAVTGESQTIVGGLVKQGYIVELGKYNATNLVVETDDEATTYAEGTDYTFDAKSGYITIVKGGNIADGTALKVTYDTPAQTIHTSATFKHAALEGEFTVVTSSQTGNNYKWVFKKLSVVQDGSFEIKGNDIGKLSFTGSALRVSDAGTLSDYFDIIEIDSEAC